MIWRDRSSVPAPDVLATDESAESAGAKERAACAAFYADPANREKSFEFKVYGDRTVRDALQRLFDGKCAYCESRFSSVHPVDVEHWRPKSAVIVGAKKIRGYYWLASIWENLLPSCIDCNRVRTHRIAPHGEERTLGKGNRFPLADENKRASSPGGESSEEPLLLNPCVDDPGTHLEFVDEGVVRARNDSSGVPSARGAASIEVYALNRTDLVLERREVLLQIHARAHTIRSLATLLDQVDESLRNLAEELLVHEMKALRRYMDANRPYSLLARQVIEEQIKLLTS